MSATHLDNRLVHYEVVGRRGQPLIFLHSWLGSWRYWLPTMDAISDRYRCYALDFWGFGESDRHESSFSLTEYVTMLFDFMENLGLARVALVGHGLGGMVALEAAARYPERFTKVMTVATPIQGNSLQHLVRPGTLSRLLGRANPTNIWARHLRHMNVDYAQLMEEIVEDTESLSEGVVRQVMDAVLGADLREKLATLQVPLVSVLGERDPIVGTEQGHFLIEEHSSLQQIVRLPKSSHFPFLDQPNVFSRLLTDFLASQGSAVEIKSEWRRRVSQLEYI